MEFFYSSDKVDIDVNKGTLSEQKIIINPVPKEALASGQIPNNLIYTATMGCVYQVQSILDNNKIDTKVNVFNDQSKASVCNLPNFPINISNFDISKIHQITDFKYRIKNSPFVDLKTKLKPLLDKKQTTINVAILNGIGTGIGDSVIGLTAIQIFHTELKKYFKEVIIDLYQTPFNININKKKLSSQEMIVNANLYLPVALDQLLKYDCVSDFSGMVSRDGFDTMPMIDFFLKNMAIDLQSIPAESKRNFIKINEKVQLEQEIKFVALKQTGRKSLMIHPLASVAIRTMPSKTFLDLIQYQLDNTEYNLIITSLPKGTTFADIKTKFNSDRVLDFTNTNDDIEEFINIISKVDYIISVDTCVYHIADSFNKPTAALFVSIDPNVRTNYYPTVHAFVISRNHKLWGAHGSLDENDEKYAHELWDKVAVSQIAECLNKAIKHTEKTTKHISCPVCQESNEYICVDKHLGIDLISCKKCESEFCEPRVADNYDRRYEEDYLHYVREGGTRELVVNGYMNQMRFENVKKFLNNITKSGTSLDVGCANGFMVAYNKDLGFDAYGIDTASSAIEYAEKCLDLKDKVFVCCDLSNLPKQMPTQYDLITSFELVEHLENPIDFAKQVYNKLAPGGIWILSTPNRNRIQFAMGVKNTGKHSGLESGDYPQEHLTRFRPKGHAILAENSGFEVLHQGTTRLLSQTIVDHSGMFPQISVKDEETGKLVFPDQQSVSNAIFNYMNPLTTSISGYGNFLVTICKKPL